MNSPRCCLRFPAFWSNEGFDECPDMDHAGAGMIQLQEMLMQTDAKKILLLPAWPKDWDVDFNLHAPYQTTVEGCVRSGRITSLILTPRSRRDDVIFLTLPPPANGN